MAKPWSEVEQSEQYQSLSPQEQLSAKQEYWDSVVSNNENFKSLDNDSKLMAKSEFFGGDMPLQGKQETISAYKPTMMQRIQDKFRNWALQQPELTHLMTQQAESDPAQAMRSMLNTATLGAPQLIKEKVFGIPSTVPDRPLGAIVGTTAGLIAPGGLASGLIRGANAASKIIPQTIPFANTVRGAITGAVTAGALSPEQSFMDWKSRLNQAKGGALVGGAMPLIMSPLQKGTQWLVGQAQKTGAIVDKTMQGLKNEMESFYAPRYSTPVNRNLLQDAISNLSKGAKEEAKSILSSVADENGVIKTDLKTAKQIQDAISSRFTITPKGSSLYKRLSPSQQNISDAYHEIKDLIRSSLPEEDAIALSNLDDKYKEGIKLSRAIKGMVLDETGQPNNPDKLISIFGGKGSQNAKQLFNRFSKFNKEINQITKQMSKYGLQRGVLNVAKKGAGVAALGEGGYLLLKDLIGGK